MYIIDKNPDFYDYFSHVYGVDKGIVFDRRGSAVLSNEILGAISVDRRGHTTGGLLLEIGYVQYILLLTNIEWDCEKLPSTVRSFDIELFHTYRENRHISEAIMSLRRFNLQTIEFGFRWGSQLTSKRKEEIEIPLLDELRRRRESDIIEKPILTNTKLTSILDPQEIWIALQIYISSLGNDRDVNIPMTDKDKAEVHGFNKQSFRHPIK